MRIRLPWPESASVYDDAGPSDELEFAVAGHEIRVVPTGDTGLHTGRQRYRVTCVTCFEVLHPGTTGPRYQIERHLDPRPGDDICPVDLDIDRLQAISRNGADTTIEELQYAVRALLGAVVRLDGIAERRRVEREQVLQVTSTDGLSSSEWLMRTAKAEGERKAATAHLELMRARAIDVIGRLSDLLDDERRKLAGDVSLPEPR